MCRIMERCLQLTEYFYCYCRDVFRAMTVLQGDFFVGTASVEKRKLINRTNQRKLQNYVELEIFSKRFTLEQ